MDSEDFVTSLQPDNVTENSCTDIPSHNGEQTSAEHNLNVACIAAGLENDVIEETSVNMVIGDILVYQNGEEEFVEETDGTTDSKSMVCLNPTEVKALQTLNIRCITTAEAAEAAPESSGQNVTVQMADMVCDELASLDSKEINGETLTDLAGQRYIIISNAEEADEVAYLQEPALKKLKVEGLDGQAYIVSVSDNGMGEIAVPDLQTMDIDISGIKPSTVDDDEPKMVLDCSKTAKLAENMDITQAWFTTKGDKKTLHNHGVSWRQGQWTKEEIDLLQNNISKYCQEYGLADPTEIIFEMTKDERKNFYRTVAHGLHRPLFSVYRRVIRMYDTKNYVGKYSTDEINRLRDLRKKHGNDWAAIGSILGRSASSVKDKCRLMKDTCNSGKWLPEEETRLAAAVYELAGIQPGESVTQGLSWSLVADKVATRSEKQCRTKWLNYLNWKQKGGTVWTRQDDINLIVRISDLNIADETQIDWEELASDWPSVRSPQWLRGKWWTVKRHVPNSENMEFTELLDSLKTVHLQNVHVMKSFLVAPNLQLTRVSNLNFHGSCDMTGDDNSLQAFEVLQHFTQNQSSYVITQPQNNSALSLHPQVSNIAADHIIVHTLPGNTLQAGDDVGVQFNKNLALQVNDHPHLIITKSGPDVASGISLDRSINQSEQVLPPVLSAEKHESGTSLPDGGSIVSLTTVDGLSTQIVISTSDGRSFEAQLAESSLDDDVEGPRSDLVGDVSVVTSADVPVIVNLSPLAFSTSKTCTTDAMSGLADPMLPSNTSDLIGSTSDVEGEKGQGDGIEDASGQVMEESSEVL